jgi:hypothetical protein
MARARNKQKQEKHIMGRTRLKIDADLRELTTKFLQDIHSIAGTSAESPAFADLNYRVVYPFQYARKQAKRVAALQAANEAEAAAIPAEALSVTAAADFKASDPGAAMYGGARSENTDDPA